MFKSVDFPLPDFPTIDTNSPRLMVKSIPLRTVTSPAAFLKVLTIPCISMSASGVDISCLCRSTLSLRDARGVIISYLFKKFPISALQLCQLPVSNFQCTCEARRKGLVMRHHDNGFSLVANQVLEQFKNMIGSD